MKRNSLTRKICNSNSSNNPNLLKFMQWYKNKNHLWYHEAMFCLYRKFFGTKMVKKAQILQLRKEKKKQGPLYYAFLCLHLKRIN